ncbi:MAG: hypothetical protein ACI8RP_001174 [Urechidicola sp.]|jgi:hypothetical protein
MKILKIIGIIFLGVIIIKIFLFMLCSFFDKGFTNHSNTLQESVNNNFLIVNYKLIPEESNSNKEILKDVSINSIFIESNWDYKCSIFKNDKQPKKVDGYNLVLPISVKERKFLDDKIFLFVHKNDTFNLRGNYTLVTSYYKEIYFDKVLKGKLVIQDHKKNETYSFKLEEGK